MADYTKGTKTNKVMLNIAQHPGVEPPEPGVASIIIDDVPIHAVHNIIIQAGSDMITRCSLVFECEVGGQIGGANVKDILRQAGEEN
jgi:hypothetical protein